MRAPASICRSRSRLAAAFLLAVATAALAIVAPVAVARTSGLTVTELEPDFMCVLCHEPLNASQAPQADQERATIGRLLAQGKTRAQIDDAMVDNYGTAVLALPPATGFNAALYILPPVALVLALASLAVALPRWRRRGRAAAAVAPPRETVLDSADAQRLDDELARYDG